MPEVGTILGPDGAVATLRHEPLSDEDATLLRTYKKFLQRHGYREALFCVRCFEGSLHDGCEAHVTPNDILIRCRCRMTTYTGGGID